MAKYVFGCTVKSIEAAAVGVQWNVVPNANYGTKYRVSGKDEDMTFAIVLPCDESSDGFVCSYTDSLPLKVEKAFVLPSLGSIDLELEDGKVDPCLGEIVLGKKNFYLTKITVK